MMITLIYGALGIIYPVALVLLLVAILLFGMGKRTKKKKGRKTQAGQSSGSKGYAGIPTGKPGASTAGAALKSGIFTNREIDTTTYMHDLSIGDRVYRSTFFLDLKAPGAANVVDVKFINALLDQYFTVTGGDRLDSTSKQNFKDRVLYWWDILHCLKLKWIDAYLTPMRTRSDTAYGAPLALSTWESVMAFLEANQFQVPQLALNLAALTTVVFQIGPGKVNQHARPSYFVPFTPHRAWTGSTGGTTWPTECTWTGSIETMINSVVGEYDSRVYQQQGMLQVRQFNRSMVQNVNIFHPSSNWGMVLGQVIPCIKDVADAETVYSSAVDSTTSIDYSHQFGGLGDDFAIWPLFRLSSDANGGICGKVAVPTDKLSIQYVDIQAGGSYADLTKTWSYSLIPQFPHVSSACGQADDYNAYRLAMHYSELAAVYPSTTSWNQRCTAWMIKNNILNQSMKSVIVGLQPSADIVISPLMARMGTTSQNSDYLTSVASDLAYWTTILSYANVYGYNSAIVNEARSQLARLPHRAAAAQNVGDV